MLLLLLLVMLLLVLGLAMQRGMPVLLLQRLLEMRLRLLLLLHMLLLHMLLLLLLLLRVLLLLLLLSVFIATGLRWLRLLLRRRRRVLSGSALRKTLIRRLPGAFAPRLCLPLRQLLNELLLRSLSTRLLRKPCGSCLRLSYPAMQRN